MNGMHETPEEIALNEKLRKAFEADRNEETLREYLMSELVFYEDFYSTMNLVKANADIIKDIRLFYIAAELSVGWNPKESFFHDKLNELFPQVGDEDKAIICYLNADKVWTSDGNEECYAYLKQSVAYAKNMKFLSNRLRLAQYLNGEAAKALLREAVDSAEVEQDQNRLSVQRWIDEFILWTTSETAREMVQSALGN